MDDQDTQPWYRQFWPWFLILLPGSAVVASLYTVSLAVRTSDSLVVAAPDGIDSATARHIAAERKARELALDARLSIDTDSGAIAVSVRSPGEAEWPATLELLFSHPTKSGLDKRLSLAAAMPLDDGTPAWAGHFVTVPEGRWYVVLHADDDWRLSGSWSGEATLDLRPASASDGT